VLVHNMSAMHPFDLAFPCTHPRETRRTGQNKARDTGRSGQRPTVRFPDRQAPSVEPRQPRSVYRSPVDATRERESEPHVQNRDS
jgi:hypothetical protein